MVTLRNKKPGDIFYPDYSRVKTLPKVSTLKVTKGVVYPINSSGQVGSIVSDARLNYKNGMVQAMEDAASGTTTVKVLMPGSRIGVKLKDSSAGDVSVGTPLYWGYSSSAIEDGAIEAEDITATTADEYLNGTFGRVFEIYGSSDDISGDFASSSTRIGTEKFTADDGDIVIVELGMR